MDFQNNVIAASDQQPILVDFWAEWCGPCLFLGPILENLEKDQSRWKLIKVNVDENPEISQQFGIRGIPDVRMFSKGEVIGQFTGAKPQQEMEKWLEEVLPDERLKVLDDLVNESITHEDTSKLQEFVKDNPDLEVGKLALARLCLWDNTKLSQKLVKDIRPGNGLFEQVKDIQTIIEFFEGDFSSGSRVEEHLTSARIIQDKDFDGGLQAVIDAVMTDKSFQNDLPRRLAIALFNYLGPQHEMTRKYRKRFDMALY